MGQAAAGARASCQSQLQPPVFREGIKGSSRHPSICLSADARTVWELQQRRHLLADRIAANLDILIGSITTKRPKRPGYNLTFKVDGVTRSRHIRKEDLPKVRLMTARHKTLKRLIGKMADLNWQILLLESGWEDQP